MNVSLKWLKRYLPIDLPIEEVSDILTTIGLEVEGVDEVESVKGGLKGIKVGEVLTKEKHPDADKLSVTTVDVGEEEPLHVVCGAPNVAAGQKVLVATIGTVLYNGDEPWKIKKGKIRGQVSEGMICAEDELGLGERHDGIMVLDENAPVGEDAATFMGLETDIVFDIGLTPNRSDATAHLGVARDLCAYLKVNTQYDGDIKEPDVSSFHVEHESESWDVEVLDKKGCPRYSAIILSDIKVGPSPKWIKELLTSVGVRPINNVVDITNFVLHELGQPLHAFDADKIEGKKVIVDKLPKGTKFKTLDEVERTLSGEDLMICDGARNGMCIAGVFGGIGTGVSDTTERIFLESAHFDANTLRKTSTKHNLRTDAAKVYEKGSDPAITVLALKRAATLLVEYAGATISSEIIDVVSHSIDPVEITVRYKNIDKIIGTEIPKEEVHNILRAMDMELSPVDEDTLKVKVPTNKADVLREIDIIEEILRIYGFNQVPIPSKISSTLHYKSYPSKRVIKESIANHLSAGGFNEMMGLSLIESSNYQKELSIPEDQMVFINNTSNIHLDIMRPEMMVSGLLSVLHNLNRQQSDLKLYEFGKSYLSKGDDIYKETEYLTIFMTGMRDQESWMTDNIAPMNFYDIKRAVLSVLGRLGITGYQVSELENYEKFYYGLSYHRGHEVLANFGEVDPAICKELGIKTKVYYAELPIEAIVKGASKSGSTVAEISKFPSTRRDLALVIDQKVKFGEVEAIAKKAGKALLKDIQLFDVYKNEEVLGEGKKSYAVSYLFEDATRTLKDKDVDKVMNQMIQQYEQKLGAHIRK